MAKTTSVANAINKKSMANEAKSVVEKALDVEERIKAAKKELAQMGAVVSNVFELLFDNSFDPVGDAEKNLEADDADFEEDFPGGKPMLQLLVKLARYGLYNQLEDVQMEVIKLRNEAAVLHAKIVYYLQEERW